MSRDLVALVSDLLSLARELLATAVGSAMPKRHAFQPAADRWLAQLQLDEVTIRKYRLYTHMWAKLWPFIEDATAPAIREYTRQRLAAVKRKTIAKELHTIRSFLRWCEEEQLLRAAPLVKLPPRTASGTPSPNRRAHRTVDLTLAEIDAIIAAAPEMSRCGPTKCGGRQYRVRDRLLVAYETGLRPETLDQLTAPGDYHLGGETLTIRDSIDKARFGRDLPLTPRAREALDRCVPANGKGELFGPCKSRLRKAIRAAARAAGIDEHRVLALKPYDLRHNRVTHLLEGGASLPGTAYLMGHKATTTTDRYAHPNVRAAAAALGIASLALTLVPRSQSSEGPTRPCVVPGAGVEPACPCERGILSAQSAHVLAALDSAIAEWRTSPDPERLRLQLAAVLSELIDLELGGIP